MRLQDPRPRDFKDIQTSRAKTTQPKAASPDPIHGRDGEWLAEMKSKLAAVEAWRGFPTHHARKSGN